MILTDLYLYNGCPLKCAIYIFPMICCTYFTQKTLIMGHTLFSRDWPSLVSHSFLGVVHKQTAQEGTTFPRAPWSTADYLSRGCRLLPSWCLAYSAKSTAPPQPCLPPLGWLPPQGEKSSSLAPAWKIKVCVWFNCALPTNINFCKCQPKSSPVLLTKMLYY